MGPNTDGCSHRGPEVIPGPLVGSREADCRGLECPGAGVSLQMGRAMAIFLGLLPTC